MGADRITANLPSRDFDRTIGFYGALGFRLRYRDAQWLILERGGFELEFFPHPDLDPRASWFSACLRTAAPEALLQEWQGAGLAGDARAIPRLTGLVKHGPGVPRMFALVDEDGSLIRCIDDRDVA